MRTSRPASTRILAAILALALWLPGPAAAAAMVRIQVVGTPIVPGGMAGAVGAAAPLDFGGSHLNANLGAAGLKGTLAAPVPGLLPVTPAAAPVAIALAAPAAPVVPAAAPESGADALAEALAGGLVRQSVMALTRAVSDSKNVGAGLARVFDQRVASDESEEAVFASEAGAELPAQASALYKEWQRSSAKRLADFEAEAAQIKSGPFGLKIVQQIDGQGRLQVGVGYTYKGYPLSEIQLKSLVRSGALDPAEWNQAQQELAGMARGLIPKLADVLRQNDAEGQAVQRKIAASVQGIFRVVPNPDYADPNRLPPPSLTNAHVSAVLGQLAALGKPQQGEASKSDPAAVPAKEALRLTGNLVYIDRNYVDSIPAGSWDKAVALMGEVAGKVFDAVKPNWTETVNAMIKAAAEKLLDTFSVYWTQEEYKSFQDLEHNTFVGIGITFTEAGAIDSVIPGGPAEKAGLKSGDKIVAVDGSAVAGTEAAVKAIRGEKGTTVRIRVERGGQVQPDISIVRAQVQTRNVYSKMAAPGVGYIYLGQFSPGSEREIFAAVKSLRGQGARKLILDLRNNPGGSVDSVSSILASFFKDGQQIASFKRQGQVMYENIADGDGRYADMPLAVLVNGGSASASEILAGAIQDVRGAVVVGSRSYGKGSMQTIVPDAQGRALKLTIGRWYTPADRNINATRDPETKEKVKDTGGIMPDHLIVLSEDQEKALMKQLYREVGGASPDGARVADPVLEKALEVLAR